MGFRNTATEFGSLAKALHWLIAIGIFGLIFLGLEQAGLERGPEKTEIRFIHGSIALAVFALMTLRLAWRFMNPVPVHPDSMAAWQRLSASLVHWGLYLAVFAQLVAGGMAVATGGKSLPFFGLFSLPLPVEENHDTHEFWEEIHEFAWKIIAVLLVVHVLGAMYNHFIAKNSVLRRMTVGLR